GDRLVLLVPLRLQRRPLLREFLRGGFGFFLQALLGGRTQPPDLAVERLHLFLVPGTLGGGVGLLLRPFRLQRRPLLRVLPSGRLLLLLVAPLLGRDPLPLLLELLLQLPTPGGVLVALLAQGLELRPRPRVRL